MTAQPIGFIGLGNMGGRMTRRLVAGGVSVLGFDVRSGQAEQCGASLAATIAEIAQACELILLSLPDSHAVEAVVEGDAGLLAHCRAGQTFVNLSTAAPRSTRSDSRPQPLPVELGHQSAGLSLAAAAHPSLTTIPLPAQP
ncbi:MAG: NAD(P)-binding domain-containing protein [Betaproteobacteria bacterium]